MMKVRIMVILLTLIAVLAAYGAGQQQAAGAAADFPARNITAINHSAAGSATDIMLRSLGMALAPHMNGHSLVIEVRSGASGGTAMSYLRGQRGDGYTLMGTTTTHPLSTVFNNLPVGYDQFRYVAGIMFDPEFMVVLSSKPYRTIPELVAYMRANPGQVIFGFAQAASSESLATYLFFEEAGVEGRTIAFQNRPEAYTALLGGHIDVIITGFRDFDAQLEAGEVNVLATILSQRAEVLPNVPSFQEFGYNIGLEKIRGIAVPIDTPDEIVERLAEMIRKAVEDPGYIQRTRDDGAEARFVPGHLLRENYDNVAKYARERMGL